MKSRSSGQREGKAGAPRPSAARSHVAAAVGAAADPQWYKDAVIYQLHVRAFRDSSADGRGDFRGLTEKLGYLQDLGVTALWLLPFYPSPLRDDGYDIADYYDVHPAYGTLRDFEKFLAAAHRAGLRVITELVINHTSDQHPWFQRSRRARPGSPERDYYVWSDTPDRYADARIIFKDFETSNWAWDPLARAYYWHRFYSHQPDLNFDHPAVRAELIAVMDFWLKLGVDGLRLDAIPYLFERDGTNCENLPETHAFLKELRGHVDRHYSGRMLLAEANQWPEDAVHYFGDGDECHMAFHFPVMPRLFMAVHMEDRFPIVEILRQTPPIPPACQWAIFLRNHDELTLEMVTDAERDYMYRAYAADPDARINLGIRRRLAPLMSNNRRRIELMKCLLFSLPGTPIVYYGDEIGMGDNIFLGDRNGVRTPMQWSSDRNAGFSAANPQRLVLPVVIDPEYHYEAVNVEAQQANPTSLLWWTKRLIALRKRYRALARGEVQFLQPENRKVLAFLRRAGDECVLIVANLSRFAQYVRLDLAEFKDCIPVELFGATAFGRIGPEPYVLTLGPHSFFWFALERDESGGTPVSETGPRATLRLEPGERWTEHLRPKSRSLEPALKEYLRRSRWVDGPERVLRTVEIVDTAPLPVEGCDLRLVIVQAGYADGEPERYALYLSCAEGAAAELWLSDGAHAVIARLEVGADQPRGVIYEAAGEPLLGPALLRLMERRRVLPGAVGQLVGLPHRGLRSILREAEGAISGRPLGGGRGGVGQLLRDEHDRKLGVLKLVRRVEAGPNPDLELSRALSEELGFAHVAPFCGACEYQSGPGRPAATLGMLQRYVPNEGDAWSVMLDALGDLLDRVVTRGAVPLPGVAPEFVYDARAAAPQAVVDLLGPCLELLRLLGRRTAELHLALARAADPALAPEPLSDFDRRSMYQTITRRLEQALQQLRQKMVELPEALCEQAQALLDREPELRGQLRVLGQFRGRAQRTRIHGDYHLGRVLFTGRDFVLIDFGGDPDRPLSERRLKQTPLYDVASMLRSLHYAAQAAIAIDLPTRGVIRAEDRPTLERAARDWCAWARAVFLQEYLARAAAGAFTPTAAAEFEPLLRACVMARAAQELSAELSRRPEWAAIPLAGLLELLPGVSDTWL